MGGFYRSAATAAAGSAREVSFRHDCVNQVQSGGAGGDRLRRRPFRAATDAQRQRQGVRPRAARRSSRSPTCASSTAPARRRASGRRCHPRRHHRGGGRRVAGDRAGRRGRASTSTGKSVIPGLVMLHEHLYYPTGPGVYGQLGESFTRLYLAGGVTTMRTGGNMNGYMDLNLKRPIEAGQKAGPGHRRHGAVRERPEHVHADDRACTTPTTRAGTWPTGRTRARRRSRPTCRSRAPRSARRSTKRTSAA